MKRLRIRREVYELLQAVKKQLEEEKRREVSIEEVLLEALQSIK